MDEKHFIIPGAGLGGCGHSKIARVCVLNWPLLTSLHFLRVTEVVTNFFLFEGL